MDLARAKKLLEMLRRRTEERGATPAEAAQAAELAEKIIHRYGLDEAVQQTDHAAGVELRDKRLPGWAQTLALAIKTRFKLEASTHVRTGKPAAVSFHGPEHAVRVAVWLYAAIAKDLDCRAHWEARVLNRRGPALVTFRNQFRQSAAFEVNKRLNPEVHRRAAEEVAAMMEAAAAKRKNRPARKCKQSATDLDRLRRFDCEAYEAGIRAGQEVSIDTNVLPDEAPRPLAMLEDRR